MATPPSSTLGAVQVDEANNAHIGSGSDFLRRAMQSRTVAKNVPHLTPILDSLPASAVVLEVGCGPGGITLDIAKRYPHLQVFGVDINEVSIKLAQDAQIASDIGNLKYTRGDAVNPDALHCVPAFEIVDAACDLVFTHASICRMPDQIQVVKNVRNACKPGGILFMAEGDAELFFSWPEMPSMFSAFSLLGNGKGADLSVGRKLLAHSIEVGFSMDDVCQVSMGESILYKPQDKAGVLRGFSEMFRDLWLDSELLRRAGVSDVDLDTILQESEDWSRIEGSMVSFPSVTVTIERARH